MSYMVRPNPNQVHKVAMHPQKVTVNTNDAAGSIAGVIIGSYYFKNYVGKVITINGERYNNNQFPSARVERYRRGRYIKIVA